MPDKLADATGGTIIEILKYGIGWIIAIVSVSASAYYFVYNKRKKKLEINFYATGMIVASVRAAHDELEVRFNNQGVTDPYIMDFSVTNVGHKDIASKDFDADKPLKVSLGAEVIARLRLPTDDKAQMFLVDSDTNTLAVAPGRLGTDVAYSIRLLVDGKPRPKLSDNPLVDTDVVLGILARKRELDLTKRLTNIGRILGLGFVSLMACVMVFSKSLGIRYGPWRSIPEAIIVGPVWAVVLLWFTVAAVVIMFSLFALAIFRMRRTVRRMERLGDKAV